MVEFLRRTAVVGRAPSLPSSMSSLREDLLRPSLSDPAAVAAAPYSNQALFVTAFLGGPVAAIGMVALNVWRLGRVRRDAAWLAASCACYVVARVLLSRSGPSLEPLLSSWLGDGADSVVLRLVALLIALLAMGCHRREQRSTDLFDLRRPSAWIPAIVLIVVGQFVDVLLARWIA